MQYKFRCKVSMDYTNSSCEDDVMIELSDKEISMLKKAIKPFCSDAPWQQIRRNAKELYQKIIQQSSDFIDYAAALDCREEGLFNDVGYEWVDGAQLMRQDIEQNGFIPCDDDGLPYRGDELDRQWFLWEKEMLKGKTYAERTQYYYNRYKFILADCLDGCTFSFTLPSELTKG